MMSLPEIVSDTSIGVDMSVVADVSLYKSAIC